MYQRRHARATPPQLVGDGIIDWLLPTRNDFPPKVRKIIKDNYDKKVQGITVAKEPVQKAVQTLFNWITLGKLNEKAKDLGYDDLYHLFMLVHLADKTLLVQKNEVVDIHEVHMSTLPKEHMRAVVSVDITFGKLMENAVKAVGPSIYLYNVATNNCQKFVTDVLKSSHLLTPELNKFINQDIDKLIKAQPGFAQTIANLTTEAAAKWNRFIQGRGTFAGRGRIAV